MAMVDRWMHLDPMLRVAVIVLSSLGLLVLGIVVGTGAMKGEATQAAGDALAEADATDIPPMDRHMPERIETATFALG